MSKKNTCFFVNFVKNNKAFVFFKDKMPVYYGCRTGFVTNDAE